MSRLSELKISKGMGPSVDNLFISLIFSCVWSHSDLFSLRLWKKDGGGGGGGGGVREGYEEEHPYMTVVPYTLNSLKGNTI